MSQFVCSECGYPSRHAEDVCDNPACLANPTLSEAHKSRIRDAARQYADRLAAAEKDRAFRARLRRKGFTTSF